jgi:ADP-ribosylglycohydrolase
MLGAIAGDMVGSVYEFDNQRTKDFELFQARTTFTDDTILTVAVAEVILQGGDYAQAFKRYYRRYPNPTGSYGARYQQWAASESLQPYNSWGNGAAMRVSPVGFAVEDWDAMLAAAEATAAVTHNHPEGIKGAQATAAAIWLGRHGKDKGAIADAITNHFGYDLRPTLADLRPHFPFDESCQGTVPPALIAFLESTDFEDALRNAVSLGGDSDTLTCITGAIAHGFYGTVPAPIATEVWSRLDPPLKEITKAFCDRYGC